MESIAATNQASDMSLEEITEQVEQIVKQEEEVHGTICIPAASTGLSSADILDALKNNEDGDAWLFISLRKNWFCYDHGLGQWFKWTGHYWMEDTIGEVYSELDALVEVYSQEAIRQAWARQTAAKSQNKDAERKAADLEKALVKRIYELQAVYRKRDILFLAAQGADSLGIAGDEWDQAPFLLGCRNGTVDLKSGEFRVGMPEDYIKTAVPTEWKGSNEPAPMWEGFLLSILEGKSELVSYIQRLLGYAITGSTKDHVIVIFWGHHGRNGKGTIFETLLYVLGQLIGPIQSEMLTSDPRKRSSAGPSPDIMFLRDRRLVWASETEEGSQFAVGKIKWLTGSDTLAGRPPYGKKVINFTPTHKIILITNHRPQLPTADPALWERLHLVPFNLSFVDNPQASYQRKRDPDLPEKLKSEASGILAWLVRGCLEWQRIGLSPPDIVLEATAQYQEDEDIFGLYLSECTREDSAQTARSGLLYNDYRRWCELFGHKWLDGKKFGERMVERYERGVDYRGRYYKGLGLITNTDNEETGGADYVCEIMEGM